MTQEYFERMKADLLAVYKDTLCEESIEDIQKASDVKSFIALLAMYSAFLNYKSIPKADWVKRWFNTTELKELAKNNGVYFEGVHAVTNPTLPIVVMGDAQIVFTCNIPRLYTISLQEESKCDITTFYASVVRVRQKDDSQCNIKHKDNLSKIKIRKV